MLHGLRGIVRGHFGARSLPHLRRPARGRARSRGPARPQRRGVDEALRRALQAHALAVRLGRVGQARVGRARGAATTPSSRPAKGGTNLFWAERLGREIGLGDLWVKQCGNAHIGLVQGSRDDRARQRRAAGDRARATLKSRAVACASTGDTSRVARGVRRGRGAPGRRAPAARQGLDRAARPAARARRAGARARHRLRRLHGDRARSSPRRTSSTSRTR